MYMKGIILLIVALMVGNVMLARTVFKLRMRQRQTAGLVCSLWAEKNDVDFKDAADFIMGRPSKLVWDTKR